MAKAAFPALTPSQLRDRIARLPRVRLAHLPTPLDEAPRLAAALGGPRIFIKRDDLTGLAFGGNKTRILEFTIADALDQGADMIIAAAFVQSNHCRQAAAAAAKLGLPILLVLGVLDESEVQGPEQGNLLLDRLLGVEIRFVRCRDLADVAQQAETIADEYRAKGRNPRVVTLGTRPAARAAVAYANATAELAEQLEALPVRPTHLYVCSCGGTQAGLVLGARALGLDARVVSFTPIARTEREAHVAKIATEAARLLDLDLVFRPEDVENHDDQLGPGYGKLTPACREAIRLVASTEGILLDPSYTGKAMAGLVDHVRRGLLGPSDTVIFVHTGGTPALFAYHQALLAP